MTHGNPEVKAVIFDLGEVLVLTGNYLTEYSSRVEKRHGLEKGSFDTKDFFPMRMTNLMKMMIGEITLEDHDRQFAKAYNQKFGTNIDKFQLAEDYHKHQLTQSIEPGFLELLRKLRDSDIQLALLTNNFFNDSEKLLPTIPHGVVEHFDYVFESCRLGMAKPDAAIYTHVLETMKISAEDCVFLDDRKPNIDAAVAMGINSIHVTEDLEAAANQLKVLLGWENSVSHN